MRRLQWPGRGRRRDDSPAATALDALSDFLRQETTGGKLLLVGTVAALVWANLSAASYQHFWGTEVGAGPAWLSLQLPLATWVSDGFLAVFFFVAGLEVKRELTVGELAGWRAAGLPLAAAIGGIALPGLVAVLASGGALSSGGGWAIPVATDIAFALGVLAVAGSALPSGVRVLLLSIAVIDDVGAILLIAALFTLDLELTWLAGGITACAAYGFAQRHRANGAVLVLLPLVAWVCVHASGVHATVTGLALGLLTPIRARPTESSSPAARLEHCLHPVSAGVVMPVFALAAAGIPLSTLGAAVSDPIAHGIVAGLLLGKPVGILAGAWLAVRLRIGEIPAGVTWADIVPVAILGGIGYTVSLLFSRVAFADPALQQRAATAVLAASIVAAVMAVVLLRRRVGVRDAADA